MDQPFISNVDASNKGLGVTFLQIDKNGKKHPVSFKSRSLHLAEKRYSVSE